MSTHGGKRPGAGRPIATATLETQKQRELLLKYLEPHVYDICVALVEKAKGGDVQAARELFDRAWGKAPQTMDVTSGGLPLLIAEADE